VIRCPRFVQRIEFKVFNRWGKEVYSLNTTDENALTIEWNGIDDNGHEVSGGVYFYTANVTFNTLRPDNRAKEFQGWVHIVR
jgi:hypothetical protein